MHLVEHMRWWSHARQWLGHRGTDAEAVLRAIVGVYSAHPSGPLALHARVQDLTATAFTALETERRALRVPAMRSSIYLVPQADAPWVLAATRTALLEYQYLLRQGHITPERYAAVKAAILPIVQEPLPIGAIQRALDAADLPLSGILKTMCREGVLLRLPGTSLLGNTLRYVATAAWVGQLFAETPVATAQHRLAAAYVRAFGPVRVTDFAWWAGITVTRARAAMAHLDLVDVGHGWLLAAEDCDAFQAVAPLAPEVLDILPPWDAYTMGYAPDGRTRLIAPEHLSACYDAVGNGVGIILVRGEAAATWHARLTNQHLTIQVHPFAALTTTQINHLTERFAAMGDFVGVATRILPTLDTAPRTTSSAHGGAPPRPKGDSMTPQPFTSHVPQKVLTDLRQRLTRTRWPDAIVGREWEDGTNRAYLQELGTYWREQFDWRVQEAALNELPQFRVAIDGLLVHFVHIRGQGPHPLPLILTHGWPSSFLEMRKILPLLTDPAQYGGDAADAFDVVVPSLPGYGFSARPTQPGMTSQRIATLWDALMTQALGYPHFVAAGGDVGGSVTEHLAQEASGHVRAIHLTNVPYQHVFAPISHPSPAEQQYLHDIAIWQQSEGAYAAIQASKPQTLGYGLTDSPMGLAAWIVEKMRAWSDCDGDVERRFTKDELLTNIMLYWVTETITSANRFYYEAAHTFGPPSPGKPTTPTGYARFPRDIVPPPRDWAARWFNLQRWTEMPSGGHFAAFEEPALLAEELRAFFRPFRAQAD